MRVEYVADPDLSADAVDAFINIQIFGRAVAVCIDDARRDVFAARIDNPGAFRCIEFTPDCGDPGRP